MTIIFLIIEGIFEQTRNIIVDWVGMWRSADLTTVVVGGESVEVRQVFGEKVCRYQSNSAS
jgi:hypothetical protein